MKRCTVLALAGLVAWPLAAGAEHARIDLRLFRLDPGTGQTRDEAHAYADTDPPAGGFNPRPLLKVKAGEPLVLQFVFTNTYPHGVKRNVTVRYFVVREEKARQKKVPALDRGVVTQGHFKLDFKPKGRVGARVRFTIKERGVYLLRVESQNTDSDHEHFSAIDVKAE